MAFSSSQRSSSSAVGVNSVAEERRSAPPGGYRNDPPSRRRGMSPGYRRALYMAAIATLRHRSLDPGSNARMQSGSKPGKIIEIVLVRKILAIVNAVIRDRKPFLTKPD